MAGRTANSSERRTTGVKILQCSAGPMRTPFTLCASARQALAGHILPALTRARRPPAPWRCWAAAAVWSGPRAAESRFVPFSEAQRSGKTGAAIPRGESGLCDPRRSQTTTGASVRLTSVAQAHPYSPRHRAERGYEPRRFSGPRKPAADGQCRRGAFQGGPQSGPRRGCGPQPKNAAAPGARNRGVGGVTRRGPCAVIASSPRYQLGPDRVDGAMSRRTDS